MKLKLFAEEYAVCRLNSDSKIPTWIDTKNFYSITKTEDELSIVCSNNNIPSDVKSEKEWRILKILGPLDFSLIGILSKLSGLLAENKISIFAISTYDTDYILIKEKDIKNACKILNCNGYEVE
ncbi:TPA: ACT domain-containing protein [Clostridioides difficile]|nr:ACT domain-containing protein [Clostridioides difficile]HCU2757600.1 ACT domain-containing protein [Clostridioides difficile]